MADGLIFAQSEILQQVTPQYWSRDVQKSITEHHRQPGPSNLHQTNDVLNKDCQVNRSIGRIARQAKMKPTSVHSSRD